MEGFRGDVRSAAREPQIASLWEEHLRHTVLFSAGIQQLFQMGRCVFLEVGPGFPMEPGQTATPGKIEARSEAIIPVTSLVPLKSNGTPEDPKMSETMYKMLKQTNIAFIVFRLSELTLKEAPKAKDAPYIFDSKGDLAVAGNCGSRRRARRQDIRT